MIFVSCEQLRRVYLQDAKIINNISCETVGEQYFKVYIFYCFRTSDVKPVDDAKQVPDIIRPDSVPLTRPTSRQRKVPISRPGSRSGSKAGSRPSSRGSMKNGHLDEVQEDGWEWEYYYEEDEEEEGKQIDDCNLKLYNN